MDKVNNQSLDNSGDLNGSDNILRCEFLVFLLYATLLYEIYLAIWKPYSDKVIHLRRHRTSSWNQEKRWHILQSVSREKYNSINPRRRKTRLLRRR